MRKFSSNITDEELYDLFREAAEKFTPALDKPKKKESWESISVILSENASRKRRSPVWKKRMAMLILLWLMAGGLSLYTIVTHRHKYVTGKKANHEHDTAKDAAKDAVTVAVNATGKRKLNDTAHHFLFISQGLLPKKNKSKMAAMEGRAGDQSRGFERRKSSMYDNENIMAFNEMALVTPAARPNCSAAVILPMQGKKKVDSLLIANKEIKKQSTGNKHQSKWSVGLVTGAEWSKVKHNSIGSMEMNYGVTVQYRFAPRWSIESGLLVVPKVYTARKEDYHKAVNYPNDLKTIDAVCRVFDVPLNLRYDILQKQNNQLFVSTGLSSFWMQKEDYTFTYELNGNSLQNEISVYNENRHLFSVGNIAVGYEYAWNNFSLQAVPYLKLPLKGIGMGKVDVGSSGIQLSIKYGIK